jgi:hypothetical protein
VVRRPALRCSQALVFTAALLTPFVASARGARLEWEAPPACAGGDALRAAVERLLGGPLEAGGTFEAHARVTLDEDRAFTLVLSVRTPEGEGTRSVRADRCDALLNVAAFSIALAINPELDQTARPVDGTTEITPLPPPPSRPAQRRPPRRMSSERATTPPLARSKSVPAELWMAAHGVADSSLLPSPGGGPGATLEAALFGAIRIGVSGAWFVPQTRYLDSGSGGEFSLWTLGLHACGQAELGVRLAACPTLRVGTLHGQGRGVAERLSQKSQVLAPGLTLMALPELSERVSAFVGVAGIFPLRRDVFVVNAGPVHEIPAFSLQLLAGLSFRAL